MNVAVKLLISFERELSYMLNSHNEKQAQTQSLQQKHMNQMKQELKAASWQENAQTNHRKSTYWYFTLQFIPY